MEVSLNDRKYKPFTRKLRLYLAPPGSAQDHLLRSINLALLKLRRGTFAGNLYRLLPHFLSDPLRRYIQRSRQTNYESIYDEFMECMRLHKDAKAAVIFPPSLDWSTQLFQRPQQLALALARQGAFVLYFQPSIEKASENFQSISENLVLCNFPFEALGRLEKPLIYLLTWNRAYAEVFQSPRILYDYVDELEVFAESPRKLLREHTSLLKKAEIVLTTAHKLYEQTLPVRPDALLCPNGVDYNFFSLHRNRIANQTPPDLVSILERGKPIIGYYGALATWFDYSLFMNVAKRRPDLSFILIGPDYDGTLPPGLLECQNIDWLGVKPYSQIPIYLQYFDVATIPFKINTVTHSVSPLKLFEYMAGGKPVVVTPMEESLFYPGVLVGATPDDFSARLDEALRLRNDDEYLATIDKVARDNTWDRRARQILDAIQSGFPLTS